MSDIPITPVTRPAPSLSPSRPSRRSRLAVRALSVALIVLGALALIDAGVTLVWEEPISALYAKVRQDHLSGALAKVERAAPTPVEERTLVNLSDVRRRVAFLAGGLQGHAKDGDPVGRIRIPRIGASFVVVKGTSSSDLASGPGIYPETVFPGMAGTTAIAGHRTTYLAPFRHVDRLRRGSRIVLSMPYAHFTYTVVAKRVVAPTDVQAAVGNVGYTRLVLSACTICACPAPGKCSSATSSNSPRRPGGQPNANRHRQRCSNPASRTSSPRSVSSDTPGGPAVTSPIQLMGISLVAASAESISVRCSAGAQKHSS
jgi:sortase A